MHFCSRFLSIRLSVRSFFQVRLYHFQCSWLWWNFVLASIVCLIVLVAITPAPDPLLDHYAIWAVKRENEWTLDIAEGCCLFVLWCDVAIRLWTLGLRYLLEPRYVWRCERCAIAAELVCGAVLQLA